jgi:undecaprenyl-diphosphatase
MNAEQFEQTLRQFLRREPFQPFVVELIDGRVIPIEDPKVVIGGGAAAFLTPDALVEFVCEDVQAIRPVVKKLVRWFRSLDLALLLTVLCVLAGVWVFIAVAYGVREGSTKPLDEGLLRALRNADDPKKPLGPAWLAEAGRDLTALGGVADLCLMTSAVAGYLLISRKYGALSLLLVATLGGLLLSTVLKDLFDRPRPAVVPHLSYVNSASFPSGHSMLSAVIYLTLGSLLARLVVQRRLKAYFLGVALLLCFLVGVSRVYLGVHYPTDVLAGWSAGLAWALLCGLVARWLQQRGMVERGAS